MKIPTRVRDGIEKMKLGIGIEKNTTRDCKLIPFQNTACRDPHLFYDVLKKSLVMLISKMMSGLKKNNYFLHKGDSFQNMNNVKIILLFQPKQ